MWPPFCLTTSCKRNIAFVTTLRHKSSESARHNFTMWAPSCATFPDSPCTKVCTKTSLSRYYTLCFCIKQYNFHLLIYSQSPVVRHFTNCWYLSHFPWTTAFTRTSVTSILRCYNFNGMIKWYDISWATLYFCCRFNKFFNVKKMSLYWKKFLFFKDNLTLRCIQRIRQFLFKITMPSHIFAIQTRIIFTKYGIILCAQGKLL